MKMTLLIYPIAYVIINPINIFYLNKVFHKAAY